METDNATAQPAPRPVEPAPEPSATTTPPSSAPATAPAATPTQQRDAVAGAAAVNESQGRAGRDLLGRAPTSPGEPAMPAAAPTTPAPTTTAAAPTTPAQTPVERARQTVRETMQNPASFRSPEAARAAAQRIQQAVAGLPQHERDRVLREEMRPLSRNITDPANGSRDQRLAVANEFASVMSRENMNSVSMVAREGGTTSQQQAMAYAVLERARMTNVVEDNRGAAATAQSNVPLARNLEPARNFLRGMIDGARDTVNGINDLRKLGNLAVRYATDPPFRAAVNGAVGALAHAATTPEGRELLRQAGMTAGSAAWNQLMENPAYAAGYVAGSIATGGALARAIGVVGAAANLPSWMVRAGRVAAGVPGPAGAVTRALQQNLRDRFEELRRQMEAQPN